MLTDAAVHQIKPRDKAFKTQDMHGMYLLVQLRGGRYWRRHYRLDGKRGTVALTIFQLPSIREPSRDRQRARMMARCAADPSEWGKTNLIPCERMAAPLSPLRAPN
ncbi:hypothetical protein ABIC65_002552 [Sphingomonas trueperi]|uniref:Arm DNA-binding domain-containing protein n=1 Tax=Sphingomonas trueperi TaxID=53317 RepID=UPI003397EBFA